METMNLEPKWAGLLPVLLDLKEHGETVESRITAKEELAKIAHAADMLVEIARNADALCNDVGNELAVPYFEEIGLMSVIRGLPENKEIA